ncbi:MAG: ABC transporter ATP-binding protein, partial [Clostridia bacterium]|nr:ABC transporter ATP-binding protein [Clostridia bacterium]
MEILRVENLSFRYPKASENALDNVSFSVNKGEFIVICGASGCGKTTLLRSLKKELMPVGEKSGTVRYKGTLIEETDDRVSASEIGFVMQMPENQIVTDKVWHEMAFGAENLGIKPDIIRRRIAETANYFGINKWIGKKTCELSGGEKQILNLASVLVAEPELLILDEPTGQLDPVAASEFLSTLKRLNSETGITVILAEHRLEDVFAAADRVTVMEEGRIIAFDDPRKISGKLKSIKKDHPATLGLPSAVRIFDALGIGGVCPLTVREGRGFIEENYSDKRSPCPVEENTRGDKTALEVRSVFFRYEKELPDVLRGADLTVYKGERYFLLGGNGSGKTTLLTVISGLNRPYKGKIEIFGKKIKDYKNNSLYR